MNNENKNCIRKEKDRDYTSDKKEAKNKKNQKIWIGFQKKERISRIEILDNNGYIKEETASLLYENTTLPYGIAEQMTENCIGTFALPFSLAPNFLIDDTEYVIPMVTEEPSVVAACSYAGKLISRSGGFKTEVHDRKMTGHVTLYDIPDLSLALKNIQKNKEKLLSIANNSYPSIIKRGGGAKDIDTKIFFEGKTHFLSFYLTVDVKEAMGANIINTMLEGVKPFLEEITGGQVLMAILSNYAIQALVTSRCWIDIKYLSNSEVEAVNIAKKMHMASILSKADISRAVTHNKGIFNGIDAVVIATGNDWRAIEAGSHAYACRNGRYEGLTTWNFNEESKKLEGNLTLPMHIASVGGSIGLNPTVKVAFDILHNPNAKTLSSIVVSVGLAQNFSALKALVTTGIQKGHMKLQARSLALLAGAFENEVSSVVYRLLMEKHMNLTAAKNILSEIRKTDIT